MAILETPGGYVSPQSTKQLALAVADADWFTTENLFRELRDDQSRPCSSSASTIATHGAAASGPGASCAIARFARSVRTSGNETSRPPGWMKTFPRIGMRPIARVIDHWKARSWRRREPRPRDDLSPLPFSQRPGPA